MKNFLLLFPKLTGPLRSIYNYYLGEPEIFYIHNEIKSKKYKYIFYDIGANYGVYTFFFGKKAEKIYVFEPVKECIEYIKAGYSKNNINLVSKIASDTNSVKQLRIPIIKKRKIFGKASIVNSFNSFEARDIESTTINDYLYQEEQKSNKLLNIIKIDVEGHENNVLNGALNVLRKKNVLVIIEIEKRHNKEYLEVFKIMFDLNFQVFFLKDKKIERISSLIKIEEKMKYNNNFIFKNY